MSNSDLINDQYCQLAGVFPMLHMRGKEDHTLIYGTISFEAHGIDGDIADEFQIEIDIPPDYPNSMPTIKEVGGRIPEDYHKFINGNLCLGARTEVYLSFYETPTLLHYVQKHVIDYLYGFSYKEKYGHHPSGERAHNDVGILEYYQEIFHVTEKTAILALLRALASDGITGLHLCPCGSGKRLRQCHRNILRTLMNRNAVHLFQFDYKYITEQPS